jgi:anaerobic selenocysteine-containing dehydrogenase
VVKNDGVISRVLGDPDHPISRGALCGKCAIAYNDAWRDKALRLANPLKRSGRKGEGQFTPISWEAALTEIADRFRALMDAGQARSILHTHYTGTVGLIGGWFPIRLFNRIGATEVDPDTVCNKAGHAALELVFGNSLEGFDPKTAEHAKCIVVWGANPSHAAPHQNRVWLRKAQDRDTKIIVVDPIGHDTARAADLHLKLVPGTDAALAFGLLHVLLNEGLIDQAFLDAHVVGADELIPAIMRMTPDRTAAMCGVPADLIRAAAETYGRGPSLLWLGQGVQRQPHGGNVFRALSGLVAFTGNLGKPGAGILYMNGPAIRGIDMASLTCPDLLRSGTESISHMDLATTLEDPQRARAFVNWNNNPAASSPEQARLRNALSRDDLFHVAIDLFHTDTTAYADIVLPAASFLEFDDLILSYFDLTLSAQVKAGDPPGEALPNQEIFRRLARALNFEDAELFEQDSDLLMRLLRQTAYQGSFNDLARLGTVDLFPSPRIQFESLQFNTPSGKIELAGERAKEQGLPRAPSPHADSRPINGRLRILSPASNWQINSSYGNDAGIQERLGAAVVTLHPADAAERLLADGDAVILRNETGQLPLVVKISDIAQPGMAIVYKGRWPSVSAGGANINTLVSGRKSDLAESTTVHGTEAYIELAGPAE